jgi:acetyltransferase-like isoleucine patch superfamily enzyme
MNLFKAANNYLETLLDKLELARHDEYTMADYLRKKGARIGENCRILVNNLGSEPYLVKIGNNCIVAPGAVFVTHDAASALFRKEIPGINIFGKIEVKDNCFIGVGATILYDTVIGPDSVVGAGSVVTRDVPPGTVAAGVPARVICSLDDFRKKTVERWEKLGLKGPRESWKEQLIAHFWEL